MAEKKEEKIEVSSTNETETMTPTDVVVQKEIKEKTISSGCGYSENSGGPMLF